tara:strand:+ start:124886 stop:125350 length:465 start_codon:yes stop_codon:yes gene_type:complete
MPIRKQISHKRGSTTVTKLDIGPKDPSEYEKECLKALDEAGDYFADNLKIREIKTIIEFRPSSPFPEEHARVLDIFDNLGLETARLRTLFREWIIEEAASSRNARSWAVRQGWIKEAEAEAVPAKKPRSKKKMMTRKKLSVIKKVYDPDPPTYH